jgi:hypothetical protein
MEGLGHVGIAMNGIASSDKETRFSVPQLEIGKQELLRKTRNSLKK